MIHRDYLLRLIQEFFQVLAAILESRRSGDLKAVEKNLDHASQAVLGMDREAVLELNERELKGELIRAGSTQEFSIRAQILSRILTESAEQASGRGRKEEAEQFYLRALNLLLDTIIGSEPVELMEFTPRIEGIVDQLSGAVLPSETLLGLMQYYEKQGDYAKAEDQLFQLCESGGLGAGLGPLGESFYQRLLDLPDAILAGGRLPRDEVEFGLREFREHCAFQQR